MAAAGCLLPWRHRFHRAFVRGRSKRDAHRCRHQRLGALAQLPPSLQFFFACLSPFHLPAGRHHTHLFNCGDNVTSDRRKDAVCITTSTTAVLLRACAPTPTYLPLLHHLPPRCAPLSLTAHYRRAPTRARAFACCAQRRAPLCGCGTACSASAVNSISILMGQVHAFETRSLHSGASRVSLW